LTKQECHAPTKAASTKQHCRLATNDMENVAWPDRQHPQSGIVVRPARGRYHKQRSRVATKETSATNQTFARPQQLRPQNRDITRPEKAATTEKSARGPERPRPQMKERNKTSCGFKRSRQQNGIVARLEEGRDDKQRRREAPKGRCNKTKHHVAQKAAPTKRNLRVARKRSQQ